MSTNEPPGGEPGRDRQPGHGGEYPPPSGQPGAGGGYPGYSGYHEGRYGEPVPDQGWTAPQDPYRPPAGMEPPTWVGPPGPPPPQWGPPPPGGPVWVPRPTNGMAVASMVLGILWIYWIGSVLALVFGYTARRQIRERGESGDGMAVAGIVLGWVGVGVLGVFLLFVLVGALSATGR